MGNSLQDQLLKAGLISEEQVEQAKAKPKPRPGRGPKKPRPKQNAAARGDRKTAPAGKRKSARPESAEERERRELREMGRQRVREEQRQQANSRQIQQRRERAKAFLSDHQENQGEGEIPYHFTVGSRIRHLYVTAPQRELLLRGELLIASIGKRDFLFASSHRDGLKALDPDVPLHDGAATEASESAETGSAEDDPYKDYTVPDDLMW